MRRFNVRQRLEHLFVMVLFIILAVTGFPQKFPEAGWARWVVFHLGGIDRTRWLHRACGLLFAILAVEHLGVVGALATARRIRLTMIPTKKDFRDAVVTLRNYLGLSEEQAAFDRFDYRQKFEYWGLVMGSIVMVLTGFILWLPTFFTRVLPGQVVPAADVAHTSEGLLAFLVVIIWHMYNAHLNPEVFPVDTSIFTGKVDEERMQKEHWLEYVQVKGDQKSESAPAPMGESEGPEKPRDGAS